MTDALLHMKHKLTMEPAGGFAAAGE